MDVGAATTLVKTAVLLVTAPAMYGEEARRRNPARVDRHWEELLSTVALIVHPLTCLTLTTQAYRIQYKDMGKELGVSIQSAINNLTHCAKKLDCKETWQ